MSPSTQSAVAADALALMLDDLRALRGAIAAGCESHAREPAVIADEAGAALIGRARDLLRRQNIRAETLRLHLRTTPGAETAAEEASSAGVAEFFLLHRQPGRPRILRDLSTLLNLAAAELALLHGAALAARAGDLAALALDQLAELTPYVMELGRLLPAAAVDDLAARGLAADNLAGAAAQRNVQEAWRNDPVECARLSSV